MNPAIKIGRLFGTAPLPEAMLTKLELDHRRKQYIDLSSAKVGHIVSH